MFESGISVNHSPGTGRGLGPRPRRAGTRRRRAVATYPARQTPAALHGLGAYLGALPRRGRAFRPQLARHPVAFPRPRRCSNPASASICAVSDCCRPTPEGLAPRPDACRSSIGLKYPGESRPRRDGAAPQPGPTVKARDMPQRPSCSAPAPRNPAPPGSAPISAMPKAPIWARLARCRSGMRPRCRKRRISSCPARPPSAACNSLWPAASACPCRGKELRWFLQQDLTRYIPYFTGLLARPGIGLTGDGPRAMPRSPQTRCAASTRALPPRV